MVSWLFDFVALEEVRFKASDSVGSSLGWDIYQAVTEKSMNCIGDGHTIMIYDPFSRPHLSVNRKIIFTTSAPHRHGKD